MRVTFYVEGLQRWARYSGDYNPIHFDEQQAKSIGLNGVVVHGMLAMMPLKRHVSLCPLVKGEHDGYRWQASLRLSVYLGVEYQLQFKLPDVNGKSVFNLCSLPEHQVKPLIGFCSPVNFGMAARQLASLSLERFQVAPEVITSKRNEYRQQFSQVNALWIFIDSLIFSLFMEQGESLIRQHEFSESLGERLRHDILFLHVSHSLMFSQGIANSLLMQPITHLSYGIYVKAAFFVEQVLHCAFAIPVWIEGEVVMVMEIGLMGMRPLNH